ncbi:MAG: hypothetical protein OXH14_19165 [Alphaproteobacteria bacterium]|nr:hypothetical protein [Alphaproteobacteria bacterium]
MTAGIVTFGCRLNAWESEAMRRLTAEAGLRSSEMHLRMCLRR